MNITPKDMIGPAPISMETAEEFSLFQERNHLHETIDGFKVYINQYAWDAFINHSTNVYKQTKHEAQGIFLGKYFKDAFGEFAVATEYSEGKGESSHAYVGMSEECVAEISGKCAAENLLMLIWIHTHPNFGVFYSGTDVNCLKTNFFMPFQSGIVVDIIRRESKGFKIDNKDLKEFSGYHIYNIAEKRLSKPYDMKTDTEDRPLKKSGDASGPDFLMKEIIAECRLIKKDLAVCQLELAGIRSIIHEQAGQSVPQQTDPGEVPEEEYFNTQFNIINEHLGRPKADSAQVEGLIFDQVRSRQLLLIALAGIYTLLGLAMVAFIGFFIKSIFRH